MSAAALPVPLWAEILVSLLLLASAVFTLAAAIGLVRLQSFFQRMHPPALIYTGAAWCVTLASITYFSAQGHGLVLHVWIIIILLSITVLHHVEAQRNVIGPVGQDLQQQVDEASKSESVV